MGASESTLNKGLLRLLHPLSLRKRKPRIHLLLLCLSLHLLGQTLELSVTERVSSFQAIAWALALQSSTRAQQLPLHLYPELRALSTVLKNQHPPPPYTLYPRHH